MNPPQYRIKLSETYIVEMPIRGLLHPFTSVSPN
jgi:hypothetical protein